MDKLKSWIKTRKSCYDTKIPLLIETLDSNLMKIKIGGEEVTIILITMKKGFNWIEKQGDLFTMLQNTVMTIFADFFEKF